MVNPWDTMYEKMSDIPKPNLVQQSIPYFLGMVFLENFVRIYQERKAIRLNDGLTSFSHTLIRLMLQ